MGEQKTGYHVPLSSLGYRISKEFTMDGIRTFIRQYLIVYVNKKRLYKDKIRSEGAVHDVPKTYQ